MIHGEGKARSGQGRRSTGSGAFLLPGQLGDILDNASSAGSYSRYSGQSVGGSSRSKAKRVASLSRPPGNDVRSVATNTSGSEYKLYSFETPKPAGVVPINEKTVSAAAERSLASAGLSIFKGRVSEVGGYDGYDWRLSVRFNAAGAAKSAELKLSGAFDPVQLGVQNALAWSSETSTYLYQLEPGSRQRLSARGRELVSGLTRSDRQGSGEFSLTMLRSALQEAVRRKANVYLVRKREEASEKSILQAILVQDIRARSWKVFRFLESKNDSKVVRTRFDSAAG